MMDDAYRHIIFQRLSLLLQVRLLDKQNANNDRKYSRHNVPLESYRPSGRIGSWQAARMASDALDMGFPILDRIEDETLFLALKQLSPRELEIIMHKYGEARMSFADMAHCTGLPFGTVSSIKSRALRKLKKNMTLGAQK